MSFEVPPVLLPVAASLFRPWIGGALYVTVALIWLIPDRRIESVLKE